MTTVNIAPALETLNHVTETMRQAPTQMQTEADRIYRRARPQIKADAHTAATVHSGKMVWSLDPKKQERALRWYYANKVPKGSRGGRHKRTGAMDKATEVTGNFSKTEGVITLENNAPGSEYVFGFKQVPSFQGLHPKFEDVAEKWGVILSDRLEVGWFTVADPFAGVTS